MFCEDFYFCFKVIDFVVLLLCDWCEDILFLIYYFLCWYLNQYLRLMLEFSYQFFQCFIEYFWLGNVCELLNLIKGLVIFNSFEWVIDQFDCSWCDIVIMVVLMLVSEVLVLLSLVVLVEVLMILVVFVLLSYVGCFCEECFGFLEVGCEVVGKVERVLIFDMFDEMYWNCCRVVGLFKVSYKIFLNKIKEYELVFE